MTSARNNIHRYVISGLSEKIFRFSDDWNSLNECHLLFFRTIEKTISSLVLSLTSSDIYWHVYSFSKQTERRLQTMYTILYGFLPFSSLLLLRVLSINDRNKPTNDCCLLLDDSVKDTRPSINTKRDFSTVWNCHWYRRKNRPIEFVIEKLFATSTINRNSPASLIQCICFFCINQSIVDIPWMSSILSSRITTNHLLPIGNNSVNWNEQVRIQSSNDTNRKVNRLSSRISISIFLISRSYEYPLFVCVKF